MKHGRGRVKEPKRIHRPSLTYDAAELLRVLGRQPFTPNSQAVAHLVLTALMATEPHEEMAKLDAKRELGLMGIPKPDILEAEGLAALETWSVGRAFRFIKWILESNIESYQRRERTHGK